MTDRTLSWEWVTEHGAVATGRPDERAVLGAKTSRTADVEKKLDGLIADAGGVKAFLDLNYGGYGHGSIGTMADGLFLHVRKVGWPFAWFLQDHPLFVGQETSTRAVDLTKQGYARTAPDDVRLRQVHETLLELFAEEKALDDARGGYRYDSYRGLLPGTIATAVTYCTNVRVGMRHLNQMKHTLGETFQAPIDDLIAGVYRLAPHGAKNARSNPVPTQRLWRWDLRYLDATRDVEDDIATPASLRGHVRLTPLTKRKDVCELPARDPERLTYLDPVWSNHRRFELRFLCTLAAARDWHRHRPAMPWEVRVVFSSMGQAMTPRVHFVTPEHLRHHAPALADCAKLITGVFHTGDPYARLHALPFCTLVEMTCEVDIRNLLYMLELRYGSSGANAEYKLQALEGLVRLHNALDREERAKVLPLASVKREDIELLGGCARPDAPARFKQEA